MSEKDAAELGSVLEKLQQHHASLQNEEELFADAPESFLDAITDGHYINHKKEIEITLNSFLCCSNNEGSSEIASERSCR